LFQFMQSWQFRSAFAFTICIQAFASGFDLIIIRRWNTHVGISDAAMYLFGDAACQNVAAQMQLMPTAVLTARLCPSGAESTVFAILAGFQNFGSSVASILGVQLAQLFHVEASKEGPCDFENLGMLVVLCHCIVPVACLPLTWCLVPRARVDDDIAFKDHSPVPSFRSPAPSPPASPLETPICDDACGAYMEHQEPDEYFLLQETQ